MSEAALITEAPIRATKASRWPCARPGRRPFVAGAGAAALLHVVVCVAVLTVVRTTMPPAAPDDLSVEVVFAPRQTPTLEPPAQAAQTTPEMPAPPPDAAELPQPPETPLPPETPQPPATTEEVQSPPAPLPEPPPIPPIEKPIRVTPPRPSAKPAPARKASPQRAQPQSPRSAEPSATPADTRTSGLQTAEEPASADWQRSLAAWLAGHKTYPYLARQRGIEGIVALRLTADRAGHVLEVNVARSAGSATLDDAAEAILRGATLPPFPPDMPRDKVTITVQIRYTLAN